MTKENDDNVYTIEQTLTDKLSLTVESEYDGLDILWAYKIQGGLEELSGQIEAAIHVLKNYKVE